MKTLAKKKCKCGRLIIIAEKGKRYKKLVCATCKTYGLEESKKQLEEIK